MAAPAIIGLSSRPKILTKFVQGFSQRRSALKFVGINSYFGGGHHIATCHRQRSHDQSAKQRGRKLGISRRTLHRRINEMNLAKAPAEITDTSGSKE